MARLVQGDRILKEVSLHYAGTVSTFSGNMEIPSDGPLELEVIAMDPIHGNFGMDRRHLTVEP